MGLKLNLGCRNRDIPGFDGMDCDPHPGVKHVGDVFDLSMFKDGAASEIYASHCLEHAPHPKTLGILREWCRVLEPQGILYVAVPDFARVVGIYAKCGLNDWIQDYVSGGQEYSTAYHMAIFDYGRLRDLLLRAGFGEASQVAEFPIGDPLDCSRNVSTLDGLPVSLNVIAIK